MPLTSPGNDDDTGENHQPTLRKNTAEPVEQTLKQNRRTLARLRPRRRRAPLAWPGFRLLARRTGRRHDARGLPEARNHGRAGTVGRARVEVHPGLRGQDRRLLRAPVHQRRAQGRRQRHPERQTTGTRLQEHRLLRHHDLPDLRQTRPQSRHHHLTITHHKQRIAKVLKPAGSFCKRLRRRRDFLLFHGH